MTAITYTAKDRGSLYAGHTAGSSYSLETDAEKLDPKRKVVGHQSEALDGTTEGSLDRIERGFSVLTDIITEAQRPLWEEFIDSVAVAEAFTFDPYGTIAAPDAPITVRMVGDAGWQRLGGMNYRLSFEVRKI